MINESSELFESLDDVGLVCTQTLKHYALLSTIKFCDRCDDCSYNSSSMFCFPCLDFLRYFILLRCIFEPNSIIILRLCCAVRRTRGMILEEHSQKLIVRDDARIKRHFHGFCVILHASVRRIRSFTSRVTHNNIFYTPNAREFSIRAPKSSVDIVCVCVCV